MPRRLTRTPAAEPAWSVASLTVTTGPSRLAPLEDRLAMLLKGVQARLQSMKHRNGAIGLLSGLS
jgi:hypothetical protein